MNLRYQLPSVRRWLLALTTAALIALSAGGAMAITTHANGADTASPIACNGPCGDPGGGGG